MSGGGKRVHDDDEHDPCRPARKQLRSASVETSSSREVSPQPGPSSANDNFNRAHRASFGAVMATVREDEGTYADNNVEMRALPSMPSLDSDEEFFEEPPPIEVPIQIPEIVGDNNFNNSVNDSMNIQIDDPIDIANPQEQQDAPLENVIVAIDEPAEANVNDNNNEQLAEQYPDPNVPADGEYLELPSLFGFDAAELFRCFYRLLASSLHLFIHAATAIGLFPDCGSRECARNRRNNQAAIQNNSMIDGLLDVEDPEQGDNRAAYVNVQENNRQNAEPIQAAHDAIVFVQLNNENANNPMGHDEVAEGPINDSQC